MLGLNFSVVDREKYVEPTACRNLQAAKGDYECDSILKTFYLFLLGFLLVL